MDRPFAAKGFDFPAPLVLERDFAASGATQFPCPVSPHCIPAQQENGVFDGPGVPAARLVRRPAPPGSAPDSSEDEFQRRDGLALIRKKKFVYFK